MGIYLRNDMEILLENIRCFYGKHDVPLTPLTFLVGENSTGKSTFLASVAAVSALGFPFVRSPFDAPPYDLGNFDNIVTFRGGRAGREGHFSIGLRDSRQGQIVARYEDDYGQPRMAQLTIRKGKRSLTIDALEKDVHIDIEAEERDGKVVRRQFTSERKPFLRQDAPYAVFDLLESMRPRESNAKLTNLLINTAFRLMDNFWAGGIGPIVPLAPVRTKPRRTYDEVTDEFSPEGDHVPIRLARLWDHGDEQTAKKIKAALKAFGEESGLYKEVLIRKLARAPGTPFQVLVKSVGRPHNLTDVGYGVSQSLPIIADSILAPEGGRVLLQQPEVHLHPKAQAALGTFFANLTSSGLQFIIETHSDYIVDRVRQEVAAGSLDPSLVQILFFEKERSTVNIRRIAIDSIGNLVNCPPKYRQFFLDEQIKILTRAGSNVPDCG